MNETKILGIEKNIREETCVIVSQNWYIWFAMILVAFFVSCVVALLDWIAVVELQPTRAPPPKYAISSIHEILVGTNRYDAR